MLLALLSLAGCVTWIDEQPACRFDVAPWSDDLEAHIMSGDGSGAFDYDPVDTPRNDIKGRYNVNTGDYTWSTTYANSYYITAGSVSGYGTAYHTGNLDILQTTTLTDVLGNTLTGNERTRRQGCNTTTETWSQDDQSDLFTSTGTYTSDTSYTWTADVPGYTWKGSMQSNLSRTETVTADDGSYASQITTKPEGTAEGTIAFTDTSGDDFSGSYKMRFDGGTEETLAETKNGAAVASIVTNYNYDGSGTETDTYADGSRCDFSIATDQSCTYSCSDGSTGSC